MKERVSGGLILAALVVWLVWSIQPRPRPKGAQDIDGTALTDTASFTQNPGSGHLVVDIGNGSNTHVPYCTDYVWIGPGGSRVDDELVVRNKSSRKTLWVCVAEEP